MMSGMENLSSESSAFTKMENRQTSGQEADTEWSVTGQPVDNERILKSESTPKLSQNNQPINLQSTV